MNQELLDQLRKPFHPSVVAWKPGAIKGERALAMPYADLRAYMNRLDEVCGGDWSVAYEPWGADRIICRLTIGSVTRSSTGETTNESEKSEIGGTVAESQAFKRACAMFGLGRYLYQLPTGWADWDAAGRKFTDKAKAKLTGILVQHYRRSTEGNSEMADVFAAHTEPEASAVAAANPALVARLERFDSLGNELYGEHWEHVCGRNVQRISGGKTRDKGELTAELVDKLIAGMELIKSKQGKSSDIIQCQVDTSTGEILDNPVDGDVLFSKNETPFYKLAWAKLTGKQYDLVDWMRQLHHNNSGPCSKAQYGYVVAIMDELTDSEHGYALSLLCQSDINGANVPSKDAASAILKFLAKTVKEKDAQGNEVKVPNPKYRQDMADMVTAMAMQTA